MTKRPRLELMIDLLILMILSVEGFHLRIDRFLMDRDIDLVLFVVWSLLIFVRFYRRNRSEGSIGGVVPYVLMAGGILLSFVPCYLYYGQGVVTSLITYRSFISFLILPILLQIKPSYQEIRTSLYAYAVIYALLTFYVTFLDHAMYIVPETESADYLSEFVYVLPGCELIVLAFIFALNDVVSSLTLRRFLISLGLFLLIFVIQSRTSLIAASVITVFSLISGGRIKAKGVYRIFVGIAFILVILFGWSGIHSLLVETQQQLSNPEYNRLKALSYMFSGQHGLLSFLWGNGFISGHVSTVVGDLQEEGIYYADVGLIGMWNQFGIITVIGILLPVIDGLRKRHTSFVRYNALFILCASMTYSYFVMPRYILWLCLYLYFIRMDQSYVDGYLADKRKKAQDAALKYSSIGS